MIHPRLLSHEIFPAQAGRGLPILRMLGIYYAITASLHDRGPLAEGSGHPTSLPSVLKPRSSFLMLQLREAHFSHYWSKCTKIAIATIFLRRGQMAREFRRKSAISKPSWLTQGKRPFQQKRLPLTLRSFKSCGAPSISGKPNLECPLCWAEHAKNPASPATPTVSNTLIAEHSMP